MTRFDSIRQAARRVRAEYERQMDEAVNLDRMGLAEDFAEAARSLNALCVAPTTDAQWRELEELDRGIYTLVIGYAEDFRLQ